MRPSPLPESIRGAAVFARLTASEIDEILRIASRVEVSGGEYVIKAGDPPDGWYLVESGEVAVTLTRPRSEDTDIACQGPGTIFGEMGVLLSEPRSADVVALAPTRLLRFATDEFSALLDRDSVAAFKVVRAMAEVLARRQRDALRSLSSVLDDEVDVPPEIAAPVKANVLERLFDGTLRAPEVAPSTEIPGSSSILELPRFLRDPINFLRERYARHGPVFCSRLLAPCLVVADREALDAVHGEHSALFSVGETYEGTVTGKVFAGTFLLGDGAEHQRVRDLLAPAITRLASDHAAKTITDVWTRWGDRMVAEPQDAFAVSQHAAYEIAGRLFVGLESDEALEAFRPVANDLVVGATHPVAIPIPFGRVNRVLKARAEVMRQLVAQVERARRRPGQSLLAQLAQVRDGGRLLDPETIAEWIVLLLWCGVETEAATAAWVLCKLAQHPEWQERLLGQQRTHGGGTPPDATAPSAAVQQEWFLSEVRRMYPDRLVVARKTLTDVAIAGWQVPRGTLVYYSPYLTHRIPADYEEPDVFDPERWNPVGTRRQQAQGTLYTFGAGARTCLGKPLALLQQQLLITTLVPRYRFHLESETPVEAAGLPVHHPVGGTIGLSRR